MTKRKKLTGIFFKNTLRTITQSPNHEEKTAMLVKASPKDREQDSTKESEIKSLKPCKLCGGLDHQRKSNRMCPFYNGGGWNPTTAIKDGQNVSKDDVIKLSKKRKASPKKKGKKTPAAVSTSEDISKTNFIKLANFFFQNILRTITK